MESLAEPPAANLAEDFGFPEGEQGFADAVDAIQDWSLWAGRPCQAGFDTGENRIKCLPDISEELVFESHRMNHNLTDLLLLSPNRSSSGNNGSAIKQWLDAVVGASGDSFGENNERSFSGFEDANGFLYGLSVDDVAIDTESSHAANTETSEPALPEEVPTGHDIDMRGQQSCELADHEWVAESGVVGSDEDAMPGPERTRNAFSMSDSEFDCAFISPEVGAIKLERLNEVWPAIAAIGRDESAGLVKDGVLHGE
jgi:hypothetical protein